jgi:hypothetical protein
LAISRWTKKWDGGSTRALEGDEAKKGYLMTDEEIESIGRRARNRRRERGEDSRGNVSRISRFEQMRAYIKSKERRREESENEK